MGATGRQTSASSVLPNRFFDSFTLLHDAKGILNDVMPECSNRKCSRSIGREFTFCPFCGKRNWAGKPRPELEEHLHEYPNDGSYCIWCGRHRDGPFYRRKPYRKPLLVAGIAATVLFVIFSGITVYCLYSPSNPYIFGYGDYCRATIRIVEKEGWYETTNGERLLEWMFVFPIAYARYRIQKWFR